MVPPWNCGTRPLALGSLAPWLPGSLAPWLPGSLDPGSWILAPGARLPVRGSRCAAPGPRLPAPGAWCLALGATRSHQALGTRRSAPGTRRSVRGARILAPDFISEIRGLRHPGAGSSPRGRNLRWPWLGFIEIIRWKTIPIHGYKNRSGRSPAMFHVKQNHRFPNAENRDTRSC